jgi:hypothetical protein
MRVGLPILLVFGLAARAAAETAAPVADHHAQILSALQEKFKYSSTSQPVPSSPASPTEVVAMKPFVVSVSRDLVEKLQPKTPDGGLTATRDWTPISRDLGGTHVDIGMMKYIPVIPSEGLPKVTLIKISW